MKARDNQDAIALDALVVLLLFHPARAVYSHHPQDSHIDCARLAGKVDIRILRDWNVQYENSSVRY